MKYGLDVFIRGTLVASLFFLGACPGLKPGARHPLLEARQLDEAVAQAFNSRDIHELMEYMWRSPDLLVLDVGEIVRGYESWKKAHLAYWEKRPDVRIEISDIKNVESTDVVLGSRNFRLLYNDKGEDKVFAGKIIDVKAYRDNRMVVISMALHGKMISPDNGD